jgi:hypothetical protein
MNATWQTIVDDQSTPLLIAHFEYGKLWAYMRPFFFLEGRNSSVNVPFIPRSPRNVFANRDHTNWYENYFRRDIFRWSQNSISVLLSTTNSIPIWMRRYGGKGCIKGVSTEGSWSRTTEPQEENLCHSFLLFIALLLMVFLVSLDATTLAVAIPVILYTALDSKRPLSSPNSFLSLGHHRWSFRNDSNRFLGQHLFYGSSRGHSAYLYQFLGHFWP